VGIASVATVEAPRQSVESPAVPPIAPRALTTRFLDFWLLGGASIAVWLIMIAVQGFRASWAIDQHFKNLTYTAASLSLLINYPHFLISYRLAYRRGWPFVAAHRWQLIVVPLALVAVFTAAFAGFDRPVGTLPLASSVTGAIGGWAGIGQVLSGPRLGDLLFTVVFNFMMLTVGWHYTKQVFGCMMVYAFYDGYALTPAQRNLTRRALLTIWVISTFPTSPRRCRSCWWGPASRWWCTRCSTPTTASAACCRASTCWCRSSRSTSGGCRRRASSSSTSC
jgi:hypothetical protein